MARRKRKRRGGGEAGPSAETLSKTADLAFFSRRLRNHTLFRVELSWKTRLHYFLTGCAAQVMARYVWEIILYLLVMVVIGVEEVRDVHQIRRCAGLATWGALLSVVIATETGRTRKKYTLIESPMAVLIFETLCWLVRAKEDSLRDLYMVSNLVFAMAGVWYMNLGDNSCRGMLRKGPEEFWKDQNSVAGVQACYNGLAMTTLPLLSCTMLVWPGGQDGFRKHKFWIALVASAYFFVRGEWPFTPKSRPMGGEGKRHEFTTYNRGENFMQILESDGTLMLPLEGAGDAIIPAFNLCWKEKDVCMISSDCTSHAYKRLLLVTLLNGLAESLTIALLIEGARRGAYGRHERTPPPIQIYGLSLLGLLHTSVANANFKRLSEKCNESNSYNVRETSKKLRSYYTSFFRGLCLVAALIPRKILGRSPIFLDRTGLVCFVHCVIRVAVMLCLCAIRKLLHECHASNGYYVRKTGRILRSYSAAFFRGLWLGAALILAMILGRRAILLKATLLISFGYSAIRVAAMLCRFALRKLLRAKSKPGDATEDKDHSNTVTGRRGRSKKCKAKGQRDREPLDTPGEQPNLNESIRSSDVILSSWARIMTMLALQIEQRSHSIEALHATALGETHVRVELENNRTDGKHESSTSSKSAFVVNDDDTTCSATSNEDIPLLAFLRSQQACIKGSVDDFHDWLIKSEDIDTMESLKEAVQDDGYLNEIMKAGDGVNRIKGYKRGPFRRAVLEHFDRCYRPSYSSDYKTTVEPPSELVCPIGLELMTNDPVVASDGITYERANIEGWFRKQLDKGGGTFLRLFTSRFPSEN